MKRNNYKFLLGIAVIFVLPLSLFLIARSRLKDNYSEGTMSIPPVYGIDSVIKDGKGHTDTFYHRVSDVAGTDQVGSKRTLYGAGSKILIIGFFNVKDTVCPLKFIEEGVQKKGQDFIQVVSFNLDSPQASVADVRKFADKYTNDHDFWWFMTGDPVKFRKFINDDLGLGHFRKNMPDFAAVPATDIIMLVDTFKHVRGYFDARDTGAMLDCVNKAFVLSIEKIKKTK